MAGIYPNRGDYQLIVSQMEEAGDGALRRAFEELKQRLRAEGLFDHRHKREILDGYHHVGLITSATGAAIRDMVSVLDADSQRRDSLYSRRRFRSGRPG